MDTIAKNKENISNENAFMGVLKLPDEQKKYLLEILYSYLFLLNIFKNKKGLIFDEDKMSGVAGMLFYTNDYIDWGVRIGYMLLRGSYEEQLEFFEDFELNGLPKIAAEMKNLVIKVNDQKEGWLVRGAVWLRFHSWVGTLLSFASWFLYIFVFLSLLYVLVATDWGRSLAWSFLDVYGAMIRVLMYVMMGIAFILIIGFVSFMYLENKTKK